MKTMHMLEQYAEYLAVKWWEIITIYITDAMFYNSETYLEIPETFAWLIIIQILLGIYHTSPGSSCDAELKMTEIELEMVSDYNKIPIIESGIRRGVSTPYGKSNIKYMGETFD